MKTEIHTMKPFRGNGMGVIRLDKLASSKNMCIKIGDIEICPIGYDTYGHPVISEENFKYYKALKANHSRESKTFLLKVEYNIMPFCIRKDSFNSTEVIKRAISDEENGLSKLKQILVWRKQFYFSRKENLNTFVLFKQYVLAQNGHVYYLESDTAKIQDDVVQIDDLKDITFSQEAHIPDSTDVCPICGKHFTLQDLKDGIISENDKAEKHHKECYSNFFKEVELCTASQIIDAVYEDTPINIWSENGLYSYDTPDGVIGIRFEEGYIIIDLSEAKSFDVSIFEQNNKCLLAYSKAQAIHFLEMFRKAI